MATMIKEKKREKRTSKGKGTSKLKSLETQMCNETYLVEELSNDAELSTSIQTVEESSSSELTILETIPMEGQVKTKNSEELTHEDKGLTIQKQITVENISIDKTGIKSELIESQNACILDDKSSSQALITENPYKDLSNQLQRVIINSNVTAITEEREDELVAKNAYTNTILEEVTPSAPFFEEMSSQTVNITSQEVVVETKPKMSCMAIEDVVRMVGGAEMEEVRVMSEKEEAIVEAGPTSGPEHPLVDLLSTFRSSLIAVERERTRLAHGYAEERKSRSTLWKIEKRFVNVSEQCACGAKVDLRASYEHAQLMKEKLPVSKLRLEGLLRDIQDSYCHHQHAALLAHCQIEELVSETVKANKNEIREALSLILQALRLSDSAPAALASALQRWAAALSAALVDARDLRQLLFVLHHLFRQTRSVSWAGRVLFMSVESAGWARTVAVLDLLLARTRLETAQECCEDTDDVWEEVDRHGSGGAVSDGTLRERDLLALLRALPLSELASRPLCPQTDIKHVREHDWCDSTGGRGVLKACCGVRVLLATLQRGSDAHVSYARLRAVLRAFAANTLHALACLHLCSRTFYTKDIEERLTVELEAAFAAGFKLFGAHELNKLPATLLSDDTAKDYCVALIISLHNSSPRHLHLLSVQLPVISCDERVRIVTQAAIDRADDHELANIVLEFLLQTGIKRKTVQCKGTCDTTARQCVSDFLSAHPYMYTVALHMFADINQTEVLDATSVKTLQVDKWKPNSGEIRALLDDWSQRCAHLLQHLLLQLDYTPYIGLTLEVQLSIGLWLCSWVKSLPAVPEWSWQVVRRLRPHRASWHTPVDAPPPDDPNDLFSIAYALLSSSWGHCIPLICSEGVPALYKLSASRPREAVHCLSNIMLVMAHSPESIALTPKFTEVITTLLNSGPSLMQRALGRGGVSGSEILMRLILAQLSQDRCGEASRASLLASWLYALCRASLPPSAAVLADVAALATRDWPTLDAYAATLLQEENSKEHINYVIRNVSSAPLLCECVLRAYHTHREARTHEYARLLTALYRQRTAGQRIHVDNAIQQIGAKMISEDLAIYRSATAAVSAPAHHPSHLAIWRLFMHLYLQRPPEQMLESTPPVGPLFFNGLMKSRTLAHIKRRMQETISYHHNELETLKQQQTPTESNVTQSTRKTKVKVDDDLLPALSIVDMTGESSDSSGSSDSESSREEGVEQDNSENSESTNDKRKLFDLITYHTAAEKLISEYLRWLEEGEKVRAAPHHVDIARFIPEHALETAWKHALSRERPPPSPELDSFPLPSLSGPPDPPPPQTPFHKAVASIAKIRDRSARRRRRIVIKSPVEDVDFKDSRTLLALVDKHLKDIERLAEEWCNEVYRVSSLDAKLWELVGALRVRRQLPPVKKQCPNKCKPLTLYIPAQEWCISEDADRGVRENRSSAAAAIRRLARPRPHAARTAAALHSIARRVRSSSAGVRVCERAWRCAARPACAAAAPARHALTALLEHVAERWIQHDGKLSAELVSRWCSAGSGCSALQQALCGALVAPRCLPAAAWPPLYNALLAADLPPHAAFSYLSKFELTRWSETADSGQRRDMLEALTSAIQRFGPAPSEDATMLLELLGVHTALLLDARELGYCLKKCARASVAGTLPCSYWPHVVRGVEASADQVPFDQLGHLLRELGVIWWEARTGLKGKRGGHLATHAQHIAQLLQALLRAFVGAAVRLSYEPERVAWYSWSALVEAWGAWVMPQPATAPLLPSTADDEQYTTMLQRFVDNVNLIMVDCPGGEIHLLQHIFEWCVQTYASVQGVAAAQESRVQASALLSALASLPWTEQPWFYGRSLQVALQMSSSTDKEITSWCCRTWSQATAASMLPASTAPEQVAPTLATLLCLFTGTLLQHSEQVLEEATLLPWWRLPEPALDEALERFFMVHHNPEKPYHELPQFKVILHASELRVRADSPAPIRQSARRHKRSVAISQWTRAACSPALAAHVATHAACLLDTLTQLAPFLEGQDSEGELEELLSRAVVIMCIEPAAAAALPVWVSWVSGTWWRLIRACVSAAAALTAFQYYATLADAAARAHMLCNESNGWPEILNRCCACPWREPHALVARGMLHAAYACAGVALHRRDAHAMRATPPALLNAQIHFVDNEPIVAVWICFACRIAREFSDQTEEARECRAAAGALLASWAEAPRRSILRVVTLHAGTDRPTPLHRLLCRFALYILEPSEVTARAYETACTATLGSTTDLTSWASTPHPKKLPRLATRLFPNHERYFKLEMDLAPDETG